MEIECEISWTMFAKSRSTKRGITRQIYRAALNNLIENKIVKIKTLGKKKIAVLLENDIWEINFKKPRKAKLKPQKTTVEIKFEPHKQEED